MNILIQNSQLKVCAKYGVTPFPCNSSQKLGISLSVREGVVPIHGMRHNPTAETSGWYVWAGEWSDSADFFKPLHVEHLKTWCPRILPMLQLAPGWRFLLAPAVEDVWFDAALLHE
jgi:hypothetical protein